MSDEKSKSDKVKKRPYVYAFSEYPKKVTGPDGKRVKVISKAEEGALHGAKNVAKKAVVAPPVAPTPDAGPAFDGDAAGDPGLTPPA